MNGYGRFANREAAGKLLAEALAAKAFPDPVVLALPRGGVPVAAEVARVLNAPLDLVMVRKIGVPYQPELAAAAVINGDDPQIVLNEEVCGLAHIDRRYIEEAAKEELQEIDRRSKLYFKNRPRVPIEGRTAIVVDDGIATGTTIRAVVKGLRLKGPKSIVLAVPVAPPDAVEALSKEADDVVCLEAPEAFFAIGLYYRDFHQVPDEEVVSLLARAPKVELPAAPPPPPRLPAKRAKPGLPAKRAKPAPPKRVAKKPRKTKNTVAPKKPPSKAKS